MDLVRGGHDQLDVSAIGADRVGASRSKDRLVVDKLGLAGVEELLARLGLCVVGDGFDRRVRRDRERRHGLVSKQRRVLGAEGTSSCLDAVQAA